MRRCTQCWKPKALAEFEGTRKALVQWCKDCRQLYRSGDRRFTRRGGLDSPELRVLFAQRSGNSKLGPIPSSISSGETCPDACTLKDSGCFAEFGLLGKHWRSVPANGLSWHQFLQGVRALPRGQLWRHNTAGDLPGVGDALDVPRLLELVSANKGRRGFTMTRKPLRSTDALAAVALANRNGFTINATAHGLADADLVADTVAGFCPMVVVLPEDAPQLLSTPAGRKVVVCPAQTTEDQTCATCQLCSNAERKSIIGFRAHGQWKARVSDLVRLRKHRDAA